MSNIFEASIILGLILAVLNLVMIWLFLYSIVKTGVKNGVLQALKEYNEYKINPPKTEDELLEEELKGWN